MKLIRSILLVAGLAATLQASEVSTTDRKVLLDHLNQSSSEFLDSVKGLTREQWEYKPSASTWSVAECAEHIALTEDFLREMVEGKVLAAKATPEQMSATKTPDEKVLKMITDRSFKAKAPEPLVPARQFATPEAALDKFKESRKTTIALASSRGDLREHFGPHPVFKELDAYQWVLYLSGHTMRHTSQIKEVKASAEFPKGQ